jgi:surfeit locus 1 family protein
LTDPSTSSASAEERPAAPRRRLLAPAIAAVVVFAALLGLGTWQVMRLQWKLDLIERVEARTGSTPVPLPDPAAWAGLSEEAWDYRPVETHGRFLEGEAYYYITLGDAKGAYDGPGYFVYAPFELDGGEIVMVNRGFVPDRLRQLETRPASAAPAGEMKISGLLRRDERGNMFIIGSDPQKRIFFVREGDEMAAALGLDPSRVAPFTIDLPARFTPEGGLPQAGETIVSFTNNHLQYAVTWYGLAVVLIVIFIVYARGEARPPRKG